MNVLKTTELDTLSDASGLGGGGDMSRAAAVLLSPSEDGRLGEAAASPS